MSRLHREEGLMLYVDINMEDDSLVIRTEEVILFVGHLQLADHATLEWVSGEGDRVRCRDGALAGVWIEIVTLKPKRTYAQWHQRETGGAIEKAASQFWPEVLLS